MSVSYKMRILVGAMNLTSPLYGGGDKALIDCFLIYIQWGMKSV